MNKEDNTILIIDDSSKVDFGGGQQITLCIADILTKTGATLIFADYTNRSRFVTQIKTRYPKSTFVAMKSKILKGPSIPTIIKRIFEIVFLKLFFRTNIAKLKQALPEDKSNLIIYVAAKKGLTLANHLRKTYGVEYIFHAHLVEQPNSLQFKAMIPYLKNAKFIICVSQAVKNSYANLTNCVMQYNPIIGTVYPPKHRTSHQFPFVVAYVGGLISIKGVQYFIDAAKSINDPNIEFRVYGDGILRKKLELESSGRVRFMGFCNDITHQLRDQVDLLILPTIIAEALPTVIIEAKASGIPVITTNIGGQAEIVKNDIDGILVDPANGNQIKQSIELLAKDLEQYNRLATSSKESQSMFSYEQFSQTITSALFI